MKNTAFSPLAMRCLFMEETKINFNKEFLFMEETKINFNKEFEKEIGKLQAFSQKPSLLVHVCCGPCFTYPYELIKNYFNITIIYNLEGADGIVTGTAQRLVALGFAEA